MNKILLITFPNTAPAGYAVDIKSEIKSQLSPVILTGDSEAIDAVAGMAQEVNVFCKNNKAKGR